jgi:hypothetical protein
MAIAIQLGIMIPYMGLSGIAASVNNPDLGELVDIADAAVDGAWDYTAANSFDLCGAPVTDQAAFDAASTGWTTVFAYNAYIYMILMIYTVLVLCCTVIPKIPTVLITCGMVCIMCTGTPLLAGAILAAIRRNSAAGSLCAENTAVAYVDGEGADATSITYQDIGSSMSTLFIVQFIFLCPMQCCALCGSGFAFLLSAAKQMEDGFMRAN